MSDYSSLKATINANVKANNNQEITGSIMNSVLNAMVNSLGAGYQFMGVATPTNPGTAQNPDYKCFYLATTPGTYTNLGSLVVTDGEVAILKYDSSWTKEVTGIATTDQLNQLGQDVDNISYQFNKNNCAAYTDVGFPFRIKAGARVINNGAVPVATGTDGSLSNRIDIQPGNYINVPLDIVLVKTISSAGDVSLMVIDGNIASLSDKTLEKVDINGINLFNPYDENVAIGKYLASNGSLNDGASYNTSGFIKVKPNTAYYTRKGGSAIRFINYYRSNGNSILGVISQEENKRYFTTPSDCNYIRVTFFASDYEQAQITEGQAYEYVRFSPLANYILNDRYNNGRLPVKSIGKNKLDPNGYGSVFGSFLQSNGSLSDNANYCISPYIPFSSGKLVCSRNESQIMTSDACICYYDSNLTFISGHSITSTKGVATWFEGVSFVRFSITGGANFNNVQVEQGEKATGYVPFGYYIPSTDIEQGRKSNVFSSQREKMTLLAGESLTLPLIYCRYAQVLSAIISGTLSSGNVEIGRGAGTNGGGAITITTTQVGIGGVNYNHGLTLTERTFVCLMTDQKGVGKIIVITSSGEKFEQDVITSIGGAAYAKNNTSGSIDVELSLEFKKINSKIWMFGDSYFSMSPLRWPYYVISEWGFDSFLLDNLSGGDSYDLWASLSNLLLIGTPKYIVWCLGMNGGADNNGNVNRSWLGRVYDVLSRCAEYNITPILATIPSVPNLPHEELNTWVRNSGYRYIDFAKAVNAQPDGTWDAGLLSSDNVHPTEAGAKVLASRVMLDFPEITKD